MQANYNISLIFIEFKILFELKSYVCTQISATLTSIPKKRNPLMHIKFKFDVYLL